jgi:hypothetical protein
LASGIVRTEQVQTLFLQGEISLGHGVTVTAGLRSDH